MKKMPIETESQRRGRQAEEIFKIKAPNCWKLKKDHFDVVGEDFKVYLKDKITNEVITEFTVQVKCAQKRKSHDVVRSQPIKLTTINYWLAQPIPTMLVVCDFTENENITNVKLYYLWINSLPLKKQNYKSTSFIIPKENILDDTLDVLPMLQLFLNNKQATFFEEKQFFYTDSCIISTQLVYLHGFIPTTHDLLSSGSCLIMIKSPGIDSAMITLGNELILSLLFTGRGSSIESGKRKYIACEGLEINTWYVQLGNVRVLLTKQYVKELCLIIDNYANFYLKRLKLISQNLGILNFRYFKHARGWKLINISKLLWQTLVKISKIYWHKNGNPSWCIFADVNDGLLIVKNNNLSEIVTKIFPYETNNTIDMVWRHVENSIWNAEETYNWLTKEFIPFTIYYVESSDVPIENAKAIIKWPWRKKIIQESSEYFKQKKIMNYYYSHKYDSIRYDNSTLTWSSLIKLLESVNVDEINTFSIAEMLALFKTCHMLVSTYKIENISYIVSKFDFKEINNQTELVQELYLMSRIYTCAGRENRHINGCLNCFVYIINAYHTYISVELLQQIITSVSWILAYTEKTQLLQCFTEIIRQSHD